MSWQPFILSLELATLTTLILLGIGLPLIYAIRFYTFKLRPFLKALVSLPLVLPPTVLGYYLLLALHPEGWIGQMSESLLGLRLVFSFPGLVIGSVIFSLPFLVNPILSAVESLPDWYTETAQSLGKSTWQTYWRVLLPNVKSSLVVGSVMAFAHTIGEFGVVLMIGGSIPGETQVASIAIYQAGEALDYTTANLYAGILLGFSLLTLVLVFVYQKRFST